MSESVDLSKVKKYFAGRFKEHGATPQGLDWNSREAQNVRFEQLSKVIQAEEPFSLIDFGCGYGALHDYLKQKGFAFRYVGYEIVEEMVEKGREMHRTILDCEFTTNLSDLQPADYVVESGIFNIKLTANAAQWSQHVQSTLEKMNALSKKGMAFNMLTSYSDPEYMRPDLYYADPCFYFDYCKRNFSRNVALLHDYQLYDFTIIVRKNDSHE